MKPHARHFALILLALAMTGMVWATVDALTPDDSLPQSQAGDITGTITPADQVATLSLTNRATDVSHEPDDFDVATGEFTFKSLPGDAAYDVQVKTTGGMTFEGIDLSFADAALIRLASARYEAIEVEAPASEPVAHADAEIITQVIAADTAFANRARCIYLAAADGHVTALVELVRDTPFHAQGDTDVIWRVELWYFEKIAGSWRRADDFNRVVDRRRLTKAEWGTLAVAFLPAMSVTIDREGESEAMVIELPAMIDSQTGRLGEAPAADDATGPILIGVATDAAP